MLVKKLSLRERELKIFSKAFTLVEMLIVVVIIGILASSLLPRLTGYLARTRDIKRQADLRNIAVAIEMYRADHGGRPLLGTSRFSGNIGSASRFSEKLTSYLSFIPKDPSRNNRVRVRTQKPYNHERNFSGNLNKGEYLVHYGAFQLQTSPYPDFVLLVAKVETPDMANYLVFNYDNSNSNGKPGNAWWVNQGGGNSGIFYPEQYCLVWDREWKKNRSFVGCDEVRKAQTPQIIDAHGKRICEYSSEDQLYYIVYIE